MRNKVLGFGIILGSLLLVSGCATVMSGTTQRVSVKAVGRDSHNLLADAHCTLTDGAGQIHTIETNPGSTVVTKGKGALTATCSMKGWKQAETAVGQNFNAWTVANVVFWPGAIVDAATGATQKYPSHITVLMTKEKATA